MKLPILSLLLFGLLLRVAEAQHFNWVHSEPVNYSLNYENPYHLIRAAGNNRVYFARTESGILNYSMSLYGTAVLGAYTENGQVLWSHSFGNQIAITALTSDNNGNVYAAGQFMESLQSGTDTLLTNTGSGLHADVFVMCFDSTGQLRWIHNKSISTFSNDVIQTIATDPSGRFYYVLQNWMESLIIPTDSAGNDLPAMTVSGSRLLGSMDFDESGNLYIAGSTESGILTIAGVSTSVTDAYMMFLARINSNGELSWVRLAHDVTFQSPVLATGIGGQTWLAGTINDSTRWGNVPFHATNWVYDIFVTRCDSLGNFSFGIQVPATAPISGDFRRGQGHFIDTDASGNVYVTGRTRGMVNWGNGVISGSGGPMNTELSLLSFDSTGTARWELSSAVNAAGIAMNVDVSTDGNCYFAASVVAPAVFGPFTVNASGGQAAVFGRIAPGTVTSGGKDLMPAEPGSLTIWPNPASEALFVNLANPDLHKSAYRIVNSLGQTMQSGILNSTGADSVCSISVSSMLPGLYHLVIFPHYSGSFVIQR